TRKCSRRVRRGTPRLSAALKGEQVDVDRPGAEACFAVAEIEFPEPAKRLVAPQRQYLSPAFEKAPAPLLQGQGVAAAEVELLDHGESGSLGTALEHWNRWQATSGEDVALDEIAALLVALEQRVVDRDRLQDDT